MRSFKGSLLNIVLITEAAVRELQIHRDGERPYGEAHGQGAGPADSSQAGHGGRGRLI